MPEMVQTTNRFDVQRLSDGLRIKVNRPPRFPLAPVDALLLAAWLVAIADPHGDVFEAILGSIREDVAGGDWDAAGDDRWVPVHPR